MLSRKLFASCLLLALISNRVTASYSLKQFPSFQTCPFLHNDRYAMKINHLYHVLQSHLENKVEQNSVCLAPFRTISESFNQIDTLFRMNRNPSLFEEIQDEILANSSCSWN